MTDSEARRTSAIYAADAEVPRPSNGFTLVAVEDTASQDGDLPILRVAAAGLPLHWNGANGAELPAVVVVDESTPGPVDIIWTLHNAETPGFEARDGRWLQQSASHDSRAGNARIAAHARYEHAQLAFAGAFLGCLTTLVLAAVGIVPGIASALATALLCGLLLVMRAARQVAGSFFPALYGGTFAGMTQVQWLSDNAVRHDGSLAAALFASLVIVWALSLLAVAVLDARSVAPIASGFAGRLVALTAVASFFFVQLPWLRSDNSVALTAALFISLAIVCGLAFLVMAMLDARLAAPIASGYGGRLGAVAAVASFVFVQQLGLFGADSSHFHGTLASVFAIEPRAASVGFLACLLGVLGTLFVLRQQFAVSAGVAERIFVASALALVGLMALDLISPNDTHASGAFYAGCFLGMSTPERVKGWYQSVFAAFVLSVVLVLVDAALPGVGGRLGFAAFVAVALVVTLSRAIDMTARAVLAQSRSRPSERHIIALDTFLGLQQGSERHDPPQGFEAEISADG